MAQARRDRRRAAQGRVAGGIRCARRRQCAVDRKAAAGHAARRQRECLSRRLPALEKTMSVEKQRLLETDTDKKNWRRWGPYLSERQWGTVREDYSPGGTAWDYFPHDHARSRAYRWGEEGIGGISDNHQRLCLALALWNGNDPILKERLFGLSGTEGNHGEDVKEYYYYLDNTPTHG